MLKLIFLFFFVSHFVSVYSESEVNNHDSIFVELDRTMKDKNVYINQKEQRISKLKKELKTSNLPLEQRYWINENLYMEYCYYIPDSSITYLDNRIFIAEKLNNKKWVVLSKLALIYQHIIQGMYIEALDSLNAVRKEAISEGLTKNYYSICKQLYRFYLPNDPLKNQNLLNYQDSLIREIDTNSSRYPFLEAEKLMDSEQWKKAREILMPLFEKTENGSHSQAMLANDIGKTYRGEKNYEMQKKYFAISAIGDMKNAVRLNESFRSLAIACYETNDINRAHKFISQSMEDALSTNFKMRMTEGAQLFSSIENSYQMKLNEEKNRFLYLLILTGIISLLLMLGIVYIYMQNNKLSAVKKNLARTNSQLNNINEVVIHINKELSEANALKETYITQFFCLCSLYVKKMETFQNSLNKKAMDRKTDELFQLLKSKDLIYSELKELYDLFDNTFLNLYPNFVNELNNLLPPDEQFEIKNNAMNAELRIFALIRLGITDSHTIADFLHYSIKTIYNYRTRLRNKALVANEEFEEKIKKIGSINV